MNVVLTLLAICGLIVLAPMALAMVLLITAYSIGAVRVWREDRRLRRDFEQVVAEKRVNR
jgi:4-amino-4-deoxy-L-arabinose transferase-like glycosyltransferase